MGIILWDKAWKFVNRVILMSWTHGEGVLSKNMCFHFSMYIALYLKYTVIHKNDSIFWGFFHIDSHCQELMVIFAKYDDFIMKHTGSMYQNTVYGKCIVYTETIIFFESTQSRWSKCLKLLLELKFYGNTTMHLYSMGNTAKILKIYSSIGIKHFWREHPFSLY